MPRVEPSEAEIGLYTWGRLVKKPHVPLASYTVDVTHFRDPQSNRGFKKIHADGRAGEIQLYVKEDPRYGALSDTIKMLAHMHLRSASDSKWLSVGIMDHHGLWTAPAIGELLCDELVAAGYRCSLYHYDIARLK